VHSLQLEAPWRAKSSTPVAVSFAGPSSYISKPKFYQDSIVCQVATFICTGTTHIFRLATQKMFVFFGATLFDLLIVEFAGRICVTAGLMDGKRWGLSRLARRSRVNKHDVDSLACIMHA
jgi:hypothetical protein